MTETTTLTRKQQEVYDFLRKNQESFEHPPTLDELCSAMGLKSRGSLHKHIKGLIEAGLVEAPNRRQRGVRLSTRKTAESLHENELPFVGSIAAGRPIEGIETISYMPVPDQLKTTNSCFVLRVKGDSMIEAGIFDGDWVIIEQRSHARNGEIVVALIEKSEVTLKTIEQCPDETVLIPANSSMQAMRYRPDQVEIQGVLVGQMRSYQ